VVTERPLSSNAYLLCRVGVELPVDLTRPGPQPATQAAVALLTSLDGDSPSRTGRQSAGDHGRTTGRS
jgi:hypothetical protein